MRLVTGIASVSTRLWQQRGKDAFALDSKTPTGDFQAFLDGEVRYNSLKRANPQRAEELFTRSESEYKARYAYLNKLKTLYGGDAE